ncbi:MAG: hypothetical protein IJX98_06125 [Clostridia bacterium]|nr:hypothetical protein [Clostridia bacterium]
MKKWRSITLACLIVACASAFAIGCNPQEETPSNGDEQTQQTPSDQTNDIYINQNWDLSGSLSDYYFVNGQGELQSELPDAETEVDFGESVFVKSPVVIDGVGNVLTATPLVKVFGGDEVTLSGGSFFALDARGYEIVYSIQTMDGQTHSATAKIEVLGADGMYLGDQYIISVKDLIMVKEEKPVYIEDETVPFAVLDSLSAEEKTKLEAEAQGGALVWKLLPRYGEEAILLQDGKLDFSQTDKGNYLLYAELVTAAGNKIVYFENANFCLINDLINEKEVKLVNVAGMDCYDLTSLMTPSEQEKLASAAQNGTVVWKIAKKNGKGVKTLASSFVDFTSVDKMNYLVYAEAENQTGKEIVFFDNADFYDLNDGFVWNTVGAETVGSVKLLSNGATDRTTVSLADKSQNAAAFAGRIGRYFQIRSTGGSQAYKLDWTPVHSKGYYELFKGQNAAVSFDFWIEATHTDGKTAIDCVFGKVYGSMNGEDKLESYRHQIFTNRWNSLSFSLDDYLLDNFEAGMVNIESLFGFAGTNGSVENSTVYIGSEPAAQVLDLNGANSYDLFNLFNSATKEELSGISDLSWKLTPMNGGAPIEQTASAVDFTAVRRGYYLVEAYSGESSLAAINVDFYDLTKDWEWNDASSALEAAVSAGVQGEAVKTGVPTNSDGSARSGNYLKFTVSQASITATLKPMHSRAYYELLAKQGYSLQYDYWYESTHGEYTLSGAFGYDPNASTGGWKWKQLTAGWKKWGTISADLDSYLVANWDTLGANTHFITVHQKCYVSGQSDIPLSESCTLYMGNFRLVKA